MGAMRYLLLILLTCVTVHGDETWTNTSAYGPYGWTKGWNGMSNALITGTSPLGGTIAQFIMSVLQTATNNPPAEPRTRLMLWSSHSHAENDFTETPTAAWNTNCYVHDFVGKTAMAICSSVPQDSHGQVPLTLVTRRVAVTAGHQLMINPTGSNVFFVTRSNTVSAHTIADWVYKASGDYSLVQFDSDVPDSIEVMRCVPYRNGDSSYSYIYTLMPATSKLLGTIWRCQHYEVCLPAKELADWWWHWDQYQYCDYMHTRIEDVHHWWVAGDSGGPNMLPIPADGGGVELLLYHCTSGVTINAAFEADIAALATANGCDPTLAKYKLSFADLSAYELPAAQQRALGQSALIVTP